MKDNILGIFNQLASNMENYQNHRDRASMDSHEKMLDILEYDYMHLTNYDAWLAALRSMFSADEAELWCAYPEYTRTEEGMTLAEVKAIVRPELAAKADVLTKQLIDKGFIYDNGGKYVETYLLDVVFVAINYFDGSPLHKACLDWWLDVSDNASASKRLRAPLPEHRVLPHEGAITGNSRHGRVPMNLEIPDTRQVLPMDKLSEVLKGVRRIAIVDCICRNAKDLQGNRECDYPTDVCFLFDESADGAISFEMGREVSYEEALDVVAHCRDLGLVQVISNAQHPLAMCNCCECCCLCLLTLNRNETAMTDVSRFIVDVVRSSDCIKCGACMNVCPSKAIEVHDTFVQTYPSKCIGCGLCVSKCPVGVLKMSKKPGAPDEIDRQYLRRIYL